MQNLNESLQAKYPHLELAVLSLSQVNKDNESKRIDSEYFKKEYLENEQIISKFECKTLEQLSTRITNGHTPYGENLQENEVKLITAEFIDDFLINEVKKFISFESHLNYLKRSILKNGDIIFSIKGKVGNAVPIFDIKEPLNINQDVAKISLKADINHFYVSAFLNSKYGKKQTEAQATGQINPFIALGVLRNLKIPLFPKPFQLEIEKLVKQSHEALEDSKRLYKEAQELLYKELELDFKNPLKSLLKSSLQAKKASELAIINDISKKYPHLNISVRPLSKSLHKSGRLDSEYYQSKYDLMETKIKSFSHKKLGELVSIQKSIEPGSEAYQDEGIEFVRVANLGKFGLSKSDIYLNEQDFSKELKKLAPKKETILLSKDGSIGISYCLEEDLECITSGAILHLKVKDKGEILPQVLSLILNSIVVKLQAERDAGGSIIAHWKISEIEKVLIPLFDFKLQEQIALKIQKSFTLRAKSKDLLQNAKIKLENAIENFCDI